MRPNRITLLVVALFVALTSTALAKTKWYVDGVHGSDSNDCKSAQKACLTIGHAISLASSGDSVMVGAATYTENLVISFSLKMLGSRATTTIIDGGGVGTAVTISNTGARVTLSRITIRNGFSATIGAGISNLATLTITASTISANTASSPCKARCGTNGGGIFNFGTLTISNSTISGNSSLVFLCHSQCGASGGGISNSGTLTISNSTITGNTVSGGGGFGEGGGIFGGTITISNTTVSGNSVSGARANGGGIWGGAATLQNSIVANNIGGNCSGTVTSTGYNLSSDNTCNFNSVGDLNNTDPKLGPLQNNGGPTQTQALTSGSPAIDAGNPHGCTDGQGHLLKTDQRGMPRPDHEDIGGCDMGAYESQSD